MRGPFLGAAFLAAFMVASSAGAEPALDRLTIDTATGPHVYGVEIARTYAEKEKGLMDRKSMAVDRGMLFEYDHDQPVTFWMKDTYIPLDMVFIRHDGRVVDIAKNAKPLDETLIDAKAPTAGVLELNAGAADAIGLKVGDTVKHPFFHDATTAR